jgi:hypothetical protein
VRSAVGQLICSSHGTRRVMSVPPLVTLRKRRQMLAVRVLAQHLDAPAGGVLPTNHHGSKGHRGPGDRLGRWSGMADTQQPSLRDRDRAGQASEFGEAGQVANRLRDGGGGLIGHAQHHDACVAAGRIGADVT